VDLNRVAVLFLAKIGSGSFLLKSDDIYHDRHQTVLGEAWL